MARTFVERFRRKISLVAAFAFMTLVFLADTPEMKGLTAELLILPGILCVFVGVIGRLWCTTYIGGRKDNQLVTDGPYSLWRNPLYVFSFVGMIGVLLTTRVFLLAAVALPVFFVYYYFVIHNEEKRLLQLFGEEYAAYCARVKVLFPALSNYHSRTSFEMNPRYYKNAMADGSMFILALVTIEAIYRLKVAGIISPILHFPF